jgi:hypothetical protein
MHEQSQPQPEVRFDPARGWICSCTGVFVERVDIGLDCHHWPLCEHLVAAARIARDKLEPPQVS